MVRGGGFLRAWRTNVNVNLKNLISIVPFGTNILAVNICTHI